MKAVRRVLPLALALATAGGLAAGTGGRAEAQPLLQVAADTVRTVAIGYEWHGLPRGPRQRELLLVRRGDDGRWTRRVLIRDGRPVDQDGPPGDPGVEPLVTRLVTSLEGAVPTIGLMTCSGWTDDNPRFDVSMLLTDGRRLRLGSTSSCDHTLPWNVTDGARLFAVYDRALPEALWALLGRPVSRGAGPVGEPPPRGDGEAVTVDTVFEALVNELTRLLVERRRRSPWVDIHTQHLAATLTWMDGAGFLARLDRLAGSPDVPVAVRRHLTGLATDLKLELELRSLRRALRPTGLPLEPRDAQDLP